MNLLTVKCKHCNKDILQDSIEHDGNIYCLNCFNELFLTCYNCDCVYERDELIEHDGNYYCNECFNELFVSCEHCGNVIESDDAIYQDDYYYCERCFNRLFVTCYNCDDVITVDYSLSAEDGHNYCEDCYNELYGRCEACDQETRRRDLDDDCHCPNCRSGNINSYSFKPKAVFFNAKKEKSDRFFGFELEVESDRDNAEIFDNIDFIYLKDDSSINDGFEIVSHPLSKAFIYENSKVFDGFMDKLTKHGARSYNTDTCGIHWHVSKSGLSSLDIYKLLHFFQTNKHFILLISQRKKEKLDRWASLDGNGEGIIKKIQDGNECRYEAISLQNSKTIEFRIFRGTLNFKSFMKNFEFVACLCDFVKAYGINDMTKDNFVKFAENNKYKHLTNFIRERNI